MADLEPFPPTPELAEKPSPVTPEEHELIHNSHSSTNLDSCVQANQGTLANPLDRENLISAKELEIKRIRAEIKRERPILEDQDSQAQYQYQSWSFDQLLDRLLELSEEIAVMRAADTVESSIHGQAIYRSASTRHQIDSLTQSSENNAQSKSPRQILESKEMASSFQTIQTSSLENSVKVPESGAKPTNQMFSAACKVPENPDPTTSKASVTDYTISRKVVYAHLGCRPLNQSFELESESALIRTREENRKETMQHISANSSTQSPLDMLLDLHHQSLEVPEESCSKQGTNQLVGAKLLASYETSFRTSGEENEEQEFKLHICYETLLSPSYGTPQIEGEEDEIEVLYGSDELSEECLRAQSSCANPLDHESNDPNVWKARAQHYESKSQRQRDDMDRLEKKLRAQGVALKESKKLTSASLERKVNELEANAKRLHKSMISGDKRIEELKDEIKALNNEISEMVALRALAKLGSNVLDRKFEYTKDPQDESIIRRGDEAAHFGSAYAEGGYFLTTFHGTPLWAEKKVWFRERYGFVPAMVFAHRHSPTFIAVCDSHYGMHEYGPSFQHEQRIAFHDMFEEFQPVVHEWILENHKQGEQPDQVETFILNDTDLLRLAKDMQDIAERAYKHQKKERDAEKARMKRL
jgi:hypothetical protein